MLSLFTYGLTFGVADPQPGSSESGSSHDLFQSSAELPQIRTKPKTEVAGAPPNPIRRLMRRRFHTN